MGHPGRPRRRNKLNSSYPYQQQPQQPVHQHHKVKQPIKEEPTNSLHDESDLISFRNDASARLIQNQELLESVTSKYFHTSKIIPPSSFPQHAKRSKKLNDQESLAYLKSLGAEGTYFGDYEIMKFVNDKLSETLKKYESDQVKVDFNDEYYFQKHSTEKLLALTNDLNDEASLTTLETEYNKILQQYKAKFNKSLTSISGGYKKFSVINKNIQQAPPGYNPRSINSMINLNQDKHGDGASSAHMPPSVVPHTNGSQVYANGSHGKNGNLEFDNNFLFQNNNKNLDDINNLFQRSDNPQQPMVDNMEDLINFGDDADVIDGGAFDEDFLSQIDHSME